MATQKVLYKGEMVEVMDMTPTWESIIHIHIAALKSGKECKGSEEEIMRMARALDTYNAKAKKKNNKGRGGS